MRNENNQKKKKDLLLAAVILVIAAAGFLIYAWTNREPAALLEIQVDGKITATYDLSRDLDTIIEGYQGGTNHLIIRDGEAWFSEASCPDKVCVHQGHIGMNGQMIVCLPNRTIARIIDSDEIDAGNQGNALSSISLFPFTSPEISSGSS